MKDVQFGDLVGRMAISLTVVLGLMFVAYRIIKRRQQGPSSYGGSRTSSLARIVGQRRTGRSGATKPGLKIVGRVGLSRNNAVLAVQFGERIFLVGTSEQSSPAVLAEIDAEMWSSSTGAGFVDELAPSVRGADRVAIRPADRVAIRPAIRSAGETKVQLPGQRMGFIEALREATARRG